MPINKPRNKERPLEPRFTTKQSRQFFMAALGVLALAFVLLILAYNQEHRSARVPVSVPAAATNIKQTVSMGAVEVAVEDVVYTKGEGTFTAPEGKRYAIVNISIKNKSDKPVQILPANDTYMKNNQGNLAYLSPYSLAEPFRAGELSPGERQKGELSYLISSDTNYNFYIDAIWSGGVMSFKTVD